MPDFLLEILMDDGLVAHRKKQSAKDRFGRRSGAYSKSSILSDMGHLNLIVVCETCCIQHATYRSSIEEGLTKRNKNGKVLGCGTHSNMRVFITPGGRYRFRADL